MMRIAWMLLCVALLLPAVVGAQQQQEQQAQEENCRPFTVSDFSKAFQYADDAFSDEWERTFRGDSTRVSITWQLAEPPSVAYLDYLIFRCGYADDVMESYFTDEYWEVTLGTYEAWEEANRCESEGITLYEFKLDSEGRPYLMRQWIEPLDETRIVMMSITAPASETDMMANYAQRLFPEFTSCRVLNP